MYPKCLMQVSGLRRTGNLSRKGHGTKSEKNSLIQPDALPSELTRHESFVRDSNPEPTAYKAVALSRTHGSKDPVCA